MKPRVPAHNQVVFIKFVSFLKEQGALEAYFENIYEESIFSAYLDGWVDSAFIWCDSKEGYDYWRNIYWNWEKICQSY